MIVLIVSLVLGMSRLVGEHGEIFQAVAHLFVGGLAVAWYFGRNRLHLVLLVTLSLIEVACALRDAGIISFPQL